MQPVGRHVDRCYPRPSDALAFIENALNHCERTGDLALRPAFLRLRALWHPDDDGPEQQVAGLIDALEAARSQGARAWELSTALSRAELWVSTGRQCAAAKLLRPLSESLTEGFDTPALKQVRTLLEKVG